MPHIYRRAKSWGFRSWHFCRNCRNWPTGNYDEVRYEPTRRCSECERLRARGNCNDTPGWL